MGKAEKAAVAKEMAKMEKTVKAGDAGTKAQERIAGDEALLLDNQLCFRLYVASKEVVRRYRPYLDPLGLTYTQYIAMMVLWEGERVSMKDLSARLDLESSTLTPLVKKLEGAGFVKRERSPEDERSTVVSVTQAGWSLRERAREVPMCMLRDLAVDPQLGADLVNCLDRFIAKLRSE